MTQDEIFDLMQALGIEKLKRSQRGDVQGLCPFHNDTRRSFGVSSEGLYNCFSCEAKGNLPMMVMRMKSFSREKAMRFVGKYGVYQDFEYIEPTEIMLALFGKKKGKAGEVPLQYFRAYQTKKNVRLAEDYLEYRELIPTVPIGFDPEQNRILLPWFGLNGEFYGCTGRAIYQNPVKYMPYWGLQRGERLFYPLRNFAKYKAKAYIIVEGELDAMRIVSLYDKTRCLPIAFGNAQYTEEQVRLLLQFEGPFLLGLDKDAAGLKSKYRLNKILDGKCVKKDLVWPGKDPCDSPLEEVLDEITYVLDKLF